MNRKANITVVLMGMAAIGIFVYQAKTGEYVTWSHKSPTSADGGCGTLDDSQLIQEAIDEAAAYAHTDPNLHFGDTMTEYVEIDPNAWDIHIPDSVWDFDPNYIEPADITICGKDFEITISTRDGKLDIVGDPNHYTEAARVFWCESAPEAVYNIFSADDKAIRHLCESGRVCEVMGHQWRDGRPGEGEDSQYADHHPGVFYRTCRLCEKCEKQWH